MRDDYDVDGAVADDPGPRHGAGPREDDVFWETAPAAERPGHGAYQPRPERGQPEDGEGVSDQVVDVRGWGHARDVA